MLELMLMPVVILVAVLSLFIAGYLFSRNYIKVSPNAVAVFSGRRRKLPDGRVVGYRMIKGGAALRIPLLEKVEYLSLNVMTIPLEIKRAYTVKGVPMMVKAVANVKIRSDDTSLQAAAERFLGMSARPDPARDLPDARRPPAVDPRHADGRGDQQRPPELRAEADERGRGRPREDGPRRGRADDPGDQRRGGVPERPRQAADRRGQARRDDRRGRGDARLEDQVGAGAPGRREGAVHGRRGNRAVAARLPHPPGAVPGGGRNAEGDRRAGRPALAGQVAPARRRRRGEGRSTADAGDDLRPGAGGPAKAEGARGDGHQAGRGGTPVGDRPGRGGQAVGDPRGRGPAVGA